MVMVVTVTAYCYGLPKKGYVRARQPASDERIHSRTALDGLRR